MDIKELRLFDRSRVVTDWKCSHARYLNYEYGGKGIVSTNQSLELFLGTVIHDSLSGIARGLDIDTIAGAAASLVHDNLMESSKAVDGVNPDFVHEQMCLIEGLIRGFHKHVWPKLIKDYPKILFIEEEMLHSYNGLGFMAKPDLVMADTEGNAVYIEYKSTSSKKDDWINSWNTAIQIHSTCRAIESTHGVKIQSTIVQGLYKGYVAYGKQTSPFCYGYKRNGNPPFTSEEVSYEYKAGLKKVPVWEVEGGIKAWVEGMPEDILATQFPQTPPIFIKDDLVNSFLKQRDYREHEIQMAVQMMEHADEESKREILNVAFPQKFDQCYPSFGYKCPYVKICFGNVTDPLKDGFVWREPHHQPEVEQWADKEVKDVGDTGYSDSISSTGTIIS